MRQVTRYYKKREYTGAGKDRLLEVLVELEAKRSKKEIEIVQSWLSADLSAKGLQDQLDVARGKFDGVECCVCFSSFPQHHFTTISLMCDHEPAVCDDCISQSVNTQVLDVAWDKIKCPECPAPLRHQDVKEWASEELFEK